MTHGFVAAGRSRVMLAALMAMRPTVVAGVGGPRRPRSTGVAARGLMSFALVSGFTSFLLAAVSMVTNLERAKFDAVSCWRTVVSVAAARARLSRAAPRQSMVAAEAGTTVWALPNGPPPQTPEVDAVV